MSHSAGGSPGADSGQGTIEVERKYEVSAGFTMPGMSGIPGVAGVTAPRTYHLTAVYFDTPGFGLAAAKITLRRRTGGTDDGWHLKLPAGAARREIHAPLGPGGEPVPAQLADLVAGWTAQRPLRPIARLRTARTVRHLLDGTGRVLAEIADDQVTGAVPGPPEPGVIMPEGDGPEANGPVADGPAAGETWREVSAWREVEIELAAGDTALLDAAGAVLLGAGARISPAASKLGQVLQAAGRLPAAAD